ncbi:MAG: leucine--tRNA ligase, partial [Proteobacteria bacterium]|nr:leucine--tRNA ligase [Pseudomonadota bacterium]
GQLKRMGFSYDWDRELATCDLSYYKWEQWLFLKMLERDLVYRKKSFVNWCESCQTVLANEQVENGSCWRCKNEVTQKELSQWFFRITKYADELLASLDTLTGWPERVVTMQRNWIGRSYGTEIDFALENSSEKITVFTTRPDTLYGATFMSLAPENPLALKLAQGTPQRESVQSFIERILKQDKTVRTAEDLEKEGVFTGAYCINPVSGFRMPVYVANFVLMEYGTGAVMAVPTHDQRDFEFTRKYGLDLIVVIQPEGETLDPKTMTQAYVEEGIMVNSQQFNGIKNIAAMEKITAHLEQKGLGKKAVNYRLKDWGISRQRYWGNPIPVIYCDTCGIVPVPEKDLPVVLPKDVAFTGMGQSPLARSPGFVNTVCPRCAKPARRETDTMDTFVESSWYFERYACPDYDTGPLDAAKVQYWMPVDQYIGGIEHAVLHLLYARFFTKVLRDLGLVQVDEPFVNLLTQGMVCKETQRCRTHGWLYPEDAENGVCKLCGSPVQMGRIEKMSKSTRNVIDPEQLIERYGADTARLFCLFAAPPERDLEWSDQGVEGAYRFLSRVWRLAAEYREELAAATPVVSGDVTEAAIRELRRKTHQTIKKVTEDIAERFHFNTAISAVMELVNQLYQFDPRQIPGPQAWSALREAVEAVVLLLAPMVPHLCEELWRELGGSDSIIKKPWPSFDPAIAEAEEAVIVIQVNGKLRGQLIVSARASAEEIQEQAMASEKVQPWISGKQIKKIITVPGKLINIVVI